MTSCSIIFVDRHIARTAAIRGYLQRFDLAVALSLNHPIPAASPPSTDLNTASITIDYGAKDIDYKRWFIVLDDTNDLANWQSQRKASDQQWTALIPPNTQLDPARDSQLLSEAGFDHCYQLPIHEQDITQIFEPITTEQSNDKPDLVLDQLSLLDDASAQAAAMGDEGLVQELRAMLRDDIVQRRQQLAKELSQNMVADAAETVHRLVGGCAYCGAKALQTASLSLENCLRQQEFESLDEHYGRWLRACDQLLPALK